MDSQIYVQISSDGQLFVKNNDLPIGELPRRIKVDGQVFNILESLNGFENYCTSSAFNGDSLYMSFILNEWVDESYTVVVGNLDLQSNQWLWTKKMSPILVAEIETSDEPYYVVELSFLDDHPELININFCNMGTGEERSSQFHRDNGAEVIIID